MPNISSLVPDYIKVSIAHELDVALQGIKCRHYHEPIRTWFRIDWCVSCDVFFFGVCKHVGWFCFCGITCLFCPRMSTNDCWIAHFRVATISEPCKKGGTKTPFFFFTGYGRCPWYKGYRRRKWTGRQGRNSIIPPPAMGK